MRFAARKHNELMRIVVDTQYKKWKAPVQAVSMLLSEAAATRIADTLNEEWQEFINNPIEEET